MEAIEIISEYVSALAAGDTEQMNSLRAPDFELDFVYSDADESAPLTSEETRQFWPSWLAGFPEKDYQITRTIAAEDVVVTQWVFTGTHSEPLGSPLFDEPVAPTGRTILFRGVSIYDIKDGLIQREATYFDLATVLVELGIQL